MATVSWCLYHFTETQRQHFSTFLFSWTSLCHKSAFCNTPFTLQAVVPRLEVLLGSGTAPLPRSPHFIWVVHTTGGQPLIGHSFLTSNNRRMTVLLTLVTRKQPQLTFGSNDQYFHSPYVAVLLWNRLHMPTVPKSEAVKNFHRTRKVMDDSSPTRKVTYRCKMAIQGQGCFPKRGLARVIPPVVWKGYNCLDFLKGHVLGELQCIKE